MRLAYLIPSANPALCASTFAAWRDMGWDTYALAEAPIKIENATGVLTQDEYEGWSRAFNKLANLVGSGYDWLATGGDDVLPDPKRSASEIGAELSDYFRGTMGVCQGIADQWAFGNSGVPVCYAPVIGAEFSRRWNGGRGALWPGYHSFFADTELFDVTCEAGLLCLREDLYLEHRHPAKTGKPSPAYHVAKQPRWQADRDLYESRKANGFPGHAPAVP